MGSELTRDQIYEIWIMLRRGGIIIAKARDRELAEYDLSPVEVGALNLIYEMNGQATPTSLSRRLLREPHTMSALVNRMEKKGLLIKASDAYRKNVVRIGLTKKGASARTLAMKIDSLQKIMSNLSNEEYQQLRSSLLKMIRNAAALLGLKANWPGVL